MVSEDLWWLCQESNHFLDFVFIASVHHEDEAAELTVTH